MGKKHSQAGHRTHKPLPMPKMLQSDTFRYPILGVLLFLLIALQGGYSDKTVGVGMAVVFIACSIGKSPLARIRERISFSVLAVCAYVLLNAAASLYSRFGSFAVDEIGKLIAAFSAYAIVLFRAKRENGPHMAAMLASVTAAIALISIDASSLNVLSRGFVSVMDFLGCSYGSMPIGYEEGVRMTGIFGNANILAGILAFGVFLSLYLARSSSSKRTQLGGCILLGINALGFLLAFSMGAIAMFVLAALIYLLAAEKGDRLSTFLFMAETAIVTLCMTFISFLGLGKSGLPIAIPVLAAPAAGILLWALHHYVGTRITASLEKHTKVAMGVVGGLVALLVLYVVAGYNLTGSYALAPGETLRRSVYPSAGTYSMTGQYNGPVTVTVESQNMKDTIMHTSSVLYSGPLEQASFEVPTDSMVVYLNLYTAEGAALDSLSLSNGPQVPLGYKLLPGFAANRIQGLWANQNAIQRVVFFRDGLRLFLQSPVIGHGLGSVEGLVTSVQDFFYESRYVHNQYIQAMAEMGILGLICFAAVLGTAAAALWMRRREEGRGPIFPALTACLAMMALHGMVEAVWSLGTYQTMALLCLATIAVQYAKPIGRLTGKVAGLATSAGMWLFSVVFLWLLGNNIVAERQYSEIKAGTRTQTAYSMTELAQRDAYNWPQYKLDMAINAVGSADIPEVFVQTAEEYAAQLRKLRIYSVNDTLERYHYPAVGRIDQVFAASREGIDQHASRATSWRSQFELYEMLFWPYGSSPDSDQLIEAQWYAEQSLTLYEKLVDFNHDRMEQITLTNQNATFIGKLLRLKQSALSGSAAGQLLRGTLFDSSAAADVNSDGIPDLMTVAAGSIKTTSDGWQLEDAVLALTVYNYYGNQYTLRLSSDNANAITALSVDGVPVPFEVSGGDVTAQITLPEDMGLERQLSVTVEGSLALRSLSLLA